MPWPRLSFRQQLTGFHLLVFVLICGVVLAAELLLRDPAPATIFDTLFVAFPIAIFASAVSTWLLAGRVVVPIREISEAARAMRPETLGERIDVVEENEASADVVRLQSELNSALSRLEEGFRAQEQFVANVAHDLKTPISVLLVEAQTIGARARTTEDYEVFAASVQDEMRRLGRLVESFLTLKRAEQGQSLVRTEPVSVNDAAISAVEHCTPVADHYEARLVVTLHEADEEDLVVTGDPDLLQTMLENLVSNAIRYSPVGEAVEIRVQAQGDNAVLMVRDHGPGIPEDELAHVFERYAQGSNTRDRAGGTGLGLAIARSVAGLHRGRIEVTNCVDGGCRFTVRLPRATAT